MKGTVTISIEEYDRFREFEKNITQGKILVVKMYSDSCDTQKDVLYFTESEAIKDAVTINKSLAEQRKKILKRVKAESQERIFFTERYYKLYGTFRSLEGELQDAKKLNWWQFRKWKKRQLTNM